MRETERHTEFKGGHNCMQSITYRINFVFGKAIFLCLSTKQLEVGIHTVSSN